MRILNLKVEDLKRVQFVDITPTSDIVEISGKNKQGKSTVLDAVWWILAGKKNHQREPIREGAESSSGRLDLGKLVVKRTWKRDTGTTAVRVFDAENAPDGTPDDDLPEWSKKPQDKLNELLGSLTFDPSEFMLKSERDQYNDIRKISKLDADIDALDAANKADYEARAKVNKAAKREEQLGIRADFKDLPKEKTDESAIVDKLQEAGEHNASIEKRKAKRDRVAGEAEQARQQASASRQSAESIEETSKRRIADLESQIKDERSAAAADIASYNTAARKFDAEAKELEEKIKAAPPLPDPIDPDGIRTLLEAAKASNRQFELRCETVAHRQKAQELKDESKSLTKKMADRTKEKMDAISKAEVPVDGLGFGEGYLTYKGKPLEQASGSEQLLVSGLIGIAENPELRVLRIRHGDQFDEDSMDVLREIAREHDFQVWIERVVPSNDAAIIMEDGMVKGA